MKEIKLLIFDWDGTLMDSVMHIVDCMRNAIQELGLESRSESEMKNIIGLGMREAIYVLYPEQQTPVFADRFTEAYREYFFTTNAPQSLFDGVVKTLQDLKQNDYWLAIATGKSRRGLDKVLAETGIGELFLESRCADETRSKPHPQMLEEILQSLQVDPQQALMIGDTEYDMEMAVNAGVLPVGVSYGVHDPDRLKQFKPAHILDNIRHLPAWLDSQTSNKPIHDNKVSIND